MFHVILIFLRLLFLWGCSVMADQMISLRWAGRGAIPSESVTPVTLTVDKKRSYKRTMPKNANLIIEGDNAPVMKSLCAGTLRLRGKVDFMLWDPPYNTGNKDFLYEDNFYLTKKAQEAWRQNNLPKRALTVKKGQKGLKVETSERLDLFVKETDASRHSKWLLFMEVRLELAKKLLKESGVIAIHIGYQELFRLGLLMDEIFGEKNRLGIINWECAYSPKNDNKGIPSTTDYVLIYAKNRDKAFRGIIPRTEEMDSRYKNIDGDSRLWTSGDLSAASGTDSYFYGIENPITGDLHFPPSGRFWQQPKLKVKEILFGWGIEYVINAAGNCVVKKGENLEKAQKILKRGAWPKIYFGQAGVGRPVLKRYRDELRNEGRIVGTYWQADEILDEIWQAEEQLNLSYQHEISGHNGGAKKLIKAILGDDCVFNTPKPLKLTERLIEMFCPKDGIVLDAFGGSATTAHAVLDLNNQGAERQFVIIERGSDHCGFADSITAERVRRVIDGNWVYPKPDTKPTGGSFVYLKAGKPISAKYILESKRADLIDVILTAHAGSEQLDDELAKVAKYVVGQDKDGKAIALVWDINKGTEQGCLTREIYRDIMAEVKTFKMKKPVFIYGSVNAGPNGSPSYTFMQIPDEILAALEITNLTD
jgi:adenine-specific DNA-methyltransferase